MLNRPNCTIFHFSTHKFFLITVSMLCMVFVASSLAARTGGDAVYREGGWANNLDHAGVYNSNGQVYEIRGYWYQGGDGVELSSWSRFLDGQSYRGAFCVPGTSSSQRDDILDTCSALDADSDITYTLFTALNYEGDPGTYISVSEISDIRCDGVVEYAYEWPSIWVWGRADPPNSGGTPTHFDISRTEYCDEHANLGGDEPWIELSPLVQRGGSGAQWTKLRQLPDLEPYQPSGWDNKLVISNVTGTTTSASTIYENESIYVDYSCLNNGEGDAGHFRFGLYIDSVLRKYVDKSSLAAGFYSYVLDSSLGTLSAGWHTFKIVCDYNEEVDESDENDNEYSRDFYITPVPDNTPPSPDPMTWETYPYETSTSSISMVATSASDSSTPVYYQFDYYSSPSGGSGGTDSGWQTSRTYTDSGLGTNHQYGYRVRARDSAPTQNTTSYSSPVSYDYTDIEIPSGITFGTITTTSIQARSTNTPSGLTRGSSGLIIYNVTNATNSGWKQNNDFWTSNPLSINTQYEFKAQARNGDADFTPDSPHSLRYTRANPPTSTSFSDVTELSIQANWTANGNPGWTQYLCENVTKGTDSGWTVNIYWNETDLDCDTQYCYQVRARNGDGVETTTIQLGCQTTLPCPEPEINIKQGTTDIPDDTGSFDFGNVLVGSSAPITFIIENIGNANLDLTGAPLVDISGTHASDFVVTQQPLTPVIPANPETFEITFSPSDEGLRSADVSISNNDSDENPYNFSIIGTGITSVYTITVSAGPNGTIDPNGDIIKSPGEDQQFIATPDPNYRVNQWYLDGNSVQIGGATYTLYDIQSNHLVYVTFRIPIIHVDVTAGGADNGTSWADAYRDFQDAMEMAVDDDQIWVAAGTYYPDPNGLADPREASFQMVNGVAIYGGFPSGGNPDFNDRDPNQYETILSGDIGVTDYRNDNCYHVFYHPDGLTLDPNAILDGLTITAGKADGPYPHNEGGGMGNFSSSPTVTNCTFAGNLGMFGGGGMYNDYNSSPTVTNCTFADNSADFGFGGGMCNWDSNPTITDCTFSGNLAQAGGGMANYSNSPTITNCTFIGNFTYSSGGGMSNSDSNLTVTGCTFSGNSADYGGGGGMGNSGDSSVTVTNCTFAGNSADYGGGMRNWDSNSILTNCILWGNTASNGNEIALKNSSTIDVVYCDVQGGLAGIYNDGAGTIIWGANNINADPLFADPNNGDYHLQCSSPCIDTGNPNSDYGKEPQPNGNRINIGVYGNTAEASVSCLDSDGDGIVNPWEIYWGLNPGSNDTDDDSLTDSYEVCYNGDCNDYDPYPTGGDLNADSVDTDGDGISDNWELDYDDCVDPLNEMDVYFDCDDDGYTNLEEFLRDTLPNDINSVPQAIVIYVDDNAPYDPGPGDPTISDPNEDGSTENPFDEIQEAIDFTIDGDTVFVLDGTYTGTGNRDIGFGGKAIKVRSQNGPENCIIDSNGSEADPHFGFSISTAETDSVLLDGFTIINGYSEYGSGIRCDGNGRISNCVLHDNFGTYGGGIFSSHLIIGYRTIEIFVGDRLITVVIPIQSQTESEIVNCVITNNSAIYGGGICYMSPIDANEIFVGPNIRNNTIVANSATYGGGIACYDNTFTSDGINPDTIITNTIVWDNNAPIGSQIFNSDDTSIIVNFSNVQGGKEEVYDPNNNLIWDIGNMNIDPNFADPANDDYHLQSEFGCWDPNSQEWVFDDVTSPCIDGGDPNSVWTAELWPHGKRINMGAYGGTPEASMSSSTIGNIADFNNDGIVNLYDFAMFAAKWPINRILLAEDIDRNNVMDIGDLKILCENWLKVIPVKFYNFSLDTDPGWSTEGEWAFGQPLGGGGSHGNPDPDSGYTGRDVYGVNLNGDYTIAVGGPYHLTAGPFDCSDYHSVHIKFARWLNTDMPNYVASKIEASNNGTDWVLVWKHTGSLDISDDSWQIMDYDISNIADNQDTVYLRWSYRILSAQAYSYSGWNIDDIELWGAP